MDDEISYKYLRKIQEMEKKSPSLTEIHPDFYTNLSTYLQDLEKRLEKEESLQKKRLLENEIENTKKIATNIYEHREKKIMLATVSKARGANPELKNLLDVEQTLFDSALNLLNKSRKDILNKKEQNRIGKKPEKIQEKKVETQTKEKPNPIVMVSKDILEFVGTDEKEYSLKKGDVLSLPEDMANMLSKRKAVKIIKQQYSRM